MTINVIKALLLSTAVLLVFNPHYSITRLIAMQSQINKAERIAGNFHN